MASRDYQEGYDAALEAIKQALAGGSQKSNSSNNQSTSNDGRDMDLGGTEAGDKMKEQSGSSNLPQDSASPGQSGESGDSQSGRGSGSQGTVTAADMTPMGGGTPNTPGGFMDSNQGNKIAEAEGYDAGPSADAIANQWKEVAIKEAQKMQGKVAGSFVSKILGLWKTNTNWKKSFRKIIGRSLNTQDKRQAFANKNILATQSRVARTDKDKFDAVDYMVVFTDSSISITDDDLKYMLSEIYQMALQLKPEAIVWAQFDTQIQDVQIYYNVAELKKAISHASVKGRGGTDCRCCWELLRNDKRFKYGGSAELVIIFTDGYLEQFKRDSKTMNNLCWAILDNAGWQLKNTEPRTSVVYLDTSQIKKK